MKIFSFFRYSRQICNFVLKYINFMRYLTYSLALNFILFCKVFCKNLATKFVRFVKLNHWWNTYFSEYLLFLFLKFGKLLQRFGLNLFFALFWNIWYIEFWKFVKYEDLRFVLKQNKMKQIGIKTNRNETKRKGKNSNWYVFYVKMFYVF
jgi:hypothetical protein